MEVKGVQSQVAAQANHRAYEFVKARAIASGQATEADFDRRAEFRATIYEVMVAFASPKFIAHALLPWPISLN